MLSAATPARAADSDMHLGSLAVPKTATAPAIDGTLGDPIWKTAATVTLGYDLRNHAAANQDTTVYMITDSAFLYVAIDAKQSIPVRATEHTNGVGLDTDDEVQVENNSFEPEWWTAGRIVNGGYVINMKIPLAVMHGTGSGDWRMQVIRYMPVTNDVFVWSYGASQSDFNSVTYSGSLDGLPKLSMLRAKPRIGVYGLGEIAGKSATPDTTRAAAGADLSIPIISGTSFVGTVHPDYSNVEIDQQTISPTAFQRFFNDFRPFFTQGANVYSYPNGICSGCPGISEFYTPNIPTPSVGYAVEGQRGLFSYGALHSIFDGRGDTGEAIDYVSANQKTALNYQGSEVDVSGFHDEANGMTLTQNNLTDLNVFARYADNAGTNVLDGKQAQRYEAGATWFDANGAAFSAVMRKIGLYFTPTDAFVQHPDIAGYDVNFFEPIKFATTARFTELDFNGDLARYHDHSGGLDQTNNGVAASLTSRTLFNLQVSTGSTYAVLPDDVFTPISQQGAQIGYNLNGLLPSFVAFNRGRFGPGLLDSWTRSATFRTGTRGALTVEGDNTDQFADSGLRHTQWLERLGYSYQSGPNQSLAIGVRRIIGTQPFLAPEPPGCLAPNESNAACGYASGWNLSAAFHQKLVGGELYVVYGNAANFSTVPRFIVKYIRYIGADKGT
jgi:hypothetical protein